MPRPERIIDLQRIVYGAHATDEERLAALEELRALERSVRLAAETATSHPMAPQGTEADGRAAGDPAPVGVDADAGAPGARVPRSPRVLVAAALVLAAAAFLGGWATGQAGSARGEEPGAAASAPAAPEAQTSGAELIPLAGTELLASFERPPYESERSPRDLWLGMGIVPDSGRLLATRADGISLWSALTVEGDVCLTMMLDELSSVAGCTTDGMIPADGIDVGVSGEGGVHARLDHLGELHVSVLGVDASPGG